MKKFLTKILLSSTFVLSIFVSLVVFIVTFLLGMLVGWLLGSEQANVLAWGRDFGLCGWLISLIWVGYEADLELKDIQ